jgi:hypothetical protein
MKQILVDFLVAFLASIPALFVALFFDRLRLPKLKVVTGEDANADNTYSAPSAHANERWKFFRVRVINQPFPLLFRWIPRYAAENCRAKVQFAKIGDEQKSFSMLSRWSSTPELPHITNDAIVKILHPDPVTIPVNESELMDIATKYENEKEAYGWNNESYFNNWRTPTYKLERGKYRVRVTVSTQNGSSFIGDFELQVADKIEDTIFKRA